MEVSTIYCTELPVDMSEREFYNLFQFADGFEQASLSSTPGNRLTGFARFTTTTQASQAITHFNGRIVDPAAGLAVRVEMAQKQLVVSNRVPSATKRSLDPTAAAYPPQKVHRTSPRNEPSYHIQPSYEGNYGYEVASPQQTAPVVCDTLHVTGMDTSTSEAEVLAVLQLLSGFKQMKYVVRSDGKKPFALVQFVDESYAAAVQSTSSGRLFLPTGRPLNFMFAKSPLGVPKVHTINSQ
jgi:RNA recognition motif-containing protein